VLGTEVLSVLSSTSGSAITRNCVKSRPLGVRVSCLALEGRGFERHGSFGLPFLICLPCVADIHHVRYDFLWHSGLV